MSAEQQPVQSEASGVDIFDEAAAIGNHRVEEMRIAGDDHNDQSLTAEGKGEESSSGTYSRQPAEGNESGCNADTVNNKQNSNDKQEKQLDSRPSSTSSAAAAKAKASTIKVASTSKLAAKSSQEPTVPLPTAVVLPFGNQPPSVDLPAGLPLLRIQRLYRDEQGTEYQKTELVEHPQVIENYLKLRTLVGHEQLRDFAFSDQKSLQDFKQFRRNITKRLVYHHSNNKKQHELKDEASRKQQSGKKVQKHGRSASEMNNSSVEQFGLRVSRKSPSLPATRQLSNKKLIGVWPDLSHLNCHACGQKGHIRTNKICPKHPANQSKMMEEVANGSSSSGISKKADTDSMLAALSIKQNAKPPSTPLDITRSRSSTAIIDVKTEPMESRQSTSVCSSGYSTSSAENNRNSNVNLLAMANGQKMVGQTMVRAGLRRPNAGKKRRFSPGVEEDQPQHLTEKRR